MKAAIYCRVSTEDQEREGSSLDSQREACLAKAKELNYEVPEGYVIAETYSGLTLDRPKLTEVREWAKGGEVDAVIVYSTDRLSRDPLHLLLLAEECDKAKVNLCFVTEPLDNSMEGQLLGFVRGWASKLEALRIRDRSSRGIRQRALAGKLFTGKGTKLFGYDYVAGKGEGEGIRYENEKEARWVREIFRWYVEDNVTIGGIARRLTSLGVPSPSGNTNWCGATIWNMLKNEGYIGKTHAYLRAYDERFELPRATPRIIDENLFNQAQARLKRNKELASRNTKRDYLLRAYVFCKHCGMRYQGTTLIKRNNKKFLYYRCTGAVKMKHCTNHTWKAEHLDALVWQEVEAALSNPDLIIAGLKAIENDDKGGYLRQELEQTRSRLAELDREQEQLLQWALKGFPEDTVVKENERINSTRAELLQRKAELETKIEHAIQADVSIQGIKEACKTVRDNLTDLTLETKRQALEVLKVKIWLDGGTVSLEGYLPIVSISACQFWS